MTLLPAWCALVCVLLQGARGFPLLQFETGVNIFELPGAELLMPPGPVANLSITLTAAHIQVQPQCGGLSLAFQHTVETL